MMTRIVLDEDLRNRLLDLAQPLELCDEEGKVLARVPPVIDLADYEPWEPQLSDEELRRREQSDKWYTTDEMLAHLKSLEEK